MRSSLTTALVTPPMSLSPSPNDGSARGNNADGWADVECLELGLWRLAAVVCLLSPTARSRGPNGAGANSLPDVGRLITVPAKRWVGEYRQIAGVLDRYGLPLVGPDPLALPLPEGHSVETNLADSSQTVFDAWFHWGD